MVTDANILMTELGVIDELSVAAIILIGLFLLYIKLRQNRNVK